MNEILVDHGVRNELAALMKVSLPTVRAALRGKTKTLKALRIRKAALESGGVEVVVVENDKKVVSL